MLDAVEAKIVGRTSTKDSLSVGSRFDCRAWHQWWHSITRGTFGACEDDHNASGAAHSAVRLCTCCTSDRWAAQKNPRIQLQAHCLLILTNLGSASPQTRLLVDSRDPRHVGRNLRDLLQFCSGEILGNGYEDKEHAHISPISFGKAQIRLKSCGPGRTRMNIHVELRP